VLAPNLVISLSSDTSQFRSTAGPPIALYHKRRTSRVALWHALSKMHKIVQNSFTTKAIKSFQILHFNLTIDNQTFDDIICIAHFTDKFTSYNWTYSLIDHKEKTLISVFKSLINQCDLIDMIINFMIRMIRNDRKIFIENKLKKWIKEQNIEWEWSSKNIRLSKTKKSNVLKLWLLKKRDVSESMQNSQKICILNAIQQSFIYSTERLSSD
jgi:hypothetical protein